MEIQQTLLYIQHDETKGVTVSYNIVTEVWSIGNDTGKTDWSDDGFLSYKISTV